MPTQNLCGMWIIPRQVVVHPNGFDEETGRRLIREGKRNAQSSEAATESPPGQTDEAIVQQTPDERIDAALDEIRSAVARELLERIGQAPPAFFEALVLDLLHALGYGATEDDLEQVGQAGKWRNRWHHFARQARF